MAYTVFVDDNFHYMDESERYKLGEFPDYASAVAACMSVVDQFLAGCDRNRTADELFSYYRSFGEDPWIKDDVPNCRFSGFHYAKLRCMELCGGAV